MPTPPKPEPRREYRIDSDKLLKKILPELKGVTSTNKVVIDYTNGVIKFYEKRDRTQPPILTISPSKAVFNDSDNNERISINGKQGSIIFKNEHANSRLILRGSGTISLRNDDNKDSIILDGNTGDIRLSGADCAEEFDIASSNNVEPGMVLVINDDGKLCPCNEPFDKRVAGVVSGANGYYPGMILDKQYQDQERVPVALVGKTYCKVDANYSSVSTGDLLTTSSTIGHAMKVNDPVSAYGSVIGKALKSLDKGCDLIPILISLQ
ncbi:MAG: hypothetical protein OEL81_01940 [Nitrosopumilus sp.]|nr:hypothetical protein [Nitrosopumilus sp.]